MCDILVKLWSKQLDFLGKSSKLLTLMGVKGSESGLTRQSRSCVSRSTARRIGPYFFFTINSQVARMRTKASLCVLSKVEVRSFCEVLVQSGPCLIMFLSVLSDFARLRRGGAEMNDKIAVVL